MRAIAVEAGPSSDEESASGKMDWIIGGMMMFAGAVFAAYVLFNAATRTPV